MYLLQKANTLENTEKKIRASKMVLEIHFAKILSREM